ncbi:MAG: hypothetical protein L0221_20430, partial [Chloroflexi bacterium]|nr:hypothetical protein [Chloroflexota bacterium]
VVDWQGGRVEVLISQYVAFLGGRIQEVAYDFYAQADDGSVWYFGEDVFDFEDGVIISTEGTWLAGRDGPAAMIMPGLPKVGDVYRPENVPAFVFEEVTVQDVDVTLDGPLGPVPGGLLISELHADGGTEAKLFGPGYGEFETSGDGDLEAVALAVPTDALSGPMPPGLATISGGALRAFEAAGLGRWADATAEVAAIRAAWDALDQAIVPRPMLPLIADALGRLDDGIQGERPARARNAAIELARLAFDLQLRYRPTTEVELARADLWAAQILVDAAASDDAGVSADVFALEYLRDRLGAVLDPAAMTRLHAHLGTLQVAVIDRDIDLAVEAAQELRGLIAELLPPG